MDLELLFWLVILLGPLLSRLLRGKKKKGGSAPPTQRPAPRPQQSRSRELTPFEEALRQIQEALAEGRAEEPKPEPRPAPKPEPRPQRLATAPPRFEKPVQVRPSKPLAAKPRFYDEKFESAAPYTSLGAKEHYHEPLGEDTSAVAVAGRPRKRKRRTKWQSAIANLVILNEPRSRKRWLPPNIR